MKRNHNLLSFFSGVFAAFLLTGLVLPALALSGKNVTIYPGVSIYLNDQRINPTDVNGNPVEVFVYNGTTYLPVRAVSKALDIPVQWDGGTSSVYLGKHTAEKPAVWVEDLEYYTRDNDRDFQLLNNPRDNMGNSYSHAVYRGYCKSTHLINGQYSAISGTLFQLYDYRDFTGTSYGGPTYSYVEIWGDGELLYRAEVTGGIKPVDFFVDLTGVLQLDIKTFCDHGTFTDTYAGIANFGLWT